MELLKTDSLQEAREKLRRETEGFKAETEMVSLEAASGRVCGEDIIAKLPVPAFCRSTVDGYAVMAEDTYGAGESSPIFLKVTGQVSIEKHTDAVLESGEAVRVQTGSMLPANATAVLMVEYTQNYAPGKLAGYRAVSEGENVIRAGEDVKQGACVISKGMRLGAHELGILATLGYAEVLVFKPLTVTVISTGDELKDVGEALSGSEIWDINSYVLAAKAVEHGMKVLRRLKITDDGAAIFREVQKASEDSDIVLLSGGSSKGNKDYTKQVLERMAGRVLTHGIAVKPGKPTILAYDREHKTVLAGLPGHPMAAVLMFQLIILDWYERRTGIKKPLPYPAVIKENVSSNQGRETCLLVKLSAGAKDYEAVPVYAKSGSISCLSEADGYTLIPRSREGLKAGERIWVERFI